MYEGSPYSDPNLDLPAAGASGHADGIVHGAVAGLPVTGADVVFYLAVVAALVLAGTLLVVLGARLGRRP